MSVIEHRPGFLSLRKFSLAAKPILNYFLLKSGSVKKLFSQTIALFLSPKAHTFFNRVC